MNAPSSEAVNRVLRSNKGKELMDAILASQNDSNNKPVRVRLNKDQVLVLERVKLDKPNRPKKNAYGTIRNYIVSLF